MASAESNQEKQQIWELFRDLGESPRTLGAAAGFSAVPGQNFVDRTLSPDTISLGKLVLDFMLLRHFGTHVAVRTPAKLNLFLEVLGRRADGYHELETLMTTVGIYDRLCVAPRDDGQIALVCRWADGWEAVRHRSATRGDRSAFDPLPVGRDNLVVRTIDRLRERAGIASGVSVWLTKTIPAAAGLGGASADAAAALIAVNALWRLTWSQERLRELAAEVGSDVPFFLGTDGSSAEAALCQGRGERMVRLTGVPRLPCVVIRPPAGLSTADVFRACRPAERPLTARQLVSALQSGSLRNIGAALHNRLMEPATVLSPWIARLQAWFARRDVIGHQMSGSGTSYFGLCRTIRQARGLASQARQAGWDAVFVATTPAA